MNTDKNTILTASNIQQIRQAGLKVCARHLRFWNVFDTKTRKIQRKLLTFKEAATKLNQEDFQYGLESKGGRTEVSIVLKDGREIRGRTDCSVKDNYVKNVGITKALGRAKGFLEKEAFV